MKPKWQKLASLAQKICTLWFQFFGQVQSLLPKDTLLRTYYTCIYQYNDGIYFYILVLLISRILGQGKSRAPFKLVLVGTCMRAFSSKLYELIQ